MVLPLDTAPGPSPDEEAARNMEISHNFLRQAREELVKEDLLQACQQGLGRGGLCN
jgi:DNA-binding IscR family transcriptional regulator